MKPYILERSTEQEFHEFFTQCFNSIVKKRNRKVKKTKLRLTDEG